MYYYAEEKQFYIICSLLQLIYSRVARICKNDAGRPDPQVIGSTPVFTTYLKARMACRASSLSTVDYYYNDLGELDEQACSNVFLCWENSCKV